MNWIRSCLSMIYGGLGILDLEKFSRALRIRWLWHEWVSPDKTWAGSDLPCDETDRLLFAACTNITLGDGRTAKFWQSGCLQGRRPKDIAPNLYKISKRKKRTVADALANNSWIRELRNSSALTVTHLAEFAQLWTMLRSTVLQQDRPDTIAWKLTACGKYLPGRHTRLNSLGALPRPRLPPSGRFGRRRNANSSHGSYYKIEYGPLTGWPNVDGHITPHAFYADRQWRLPCTW